jgi:uncharacterized SAM-binding protein YcdF (DUF218 family)
LIRRLFLLIPLLWVLGLAWFVLAMPGPAPGVRTDGAIVLTGGAGRVARGVEVLRKDWSPALLVSGVDRSVRRPEFQQANRVPGRLMTCCITLGQDAVNTVSNADEAADWIRARNFRTVRLITSNWHMRRARLELEAVIGDEASIVADGVPEAPTLRRIIREYHKYLVRRFWVLAGQ